MLQTAERTLRAVALVSTRGRITLTELAHELAISPSMAHRILSTCVHQGYLVQSRRGSAYRVGPALRQLAADVDRGVDLVPLLEPTLKRAARTLMETCNLVVLEGTDIRFVLSVEGTHLVRIAHPIRRTTPAHATAGGRAILAALPDAEIQRRFAHHDWTRAPNSQVTSADDLKLELARIRRRTWALQVGEAQTGVAAVALPLHDASSAPIAAISATVPYQRMAQATDASTLVEQLRPFALRMEEILRNSSTNSSPRK